MNPRRHVRARRIATQLAAYEQRRTYERRIAARLGAALSDPATSIQSLSRVGVTLCWRQKWAIRLLFWPRWQWTRGIAQRLILHLLKEQP